MTGEQEQVFLESGRWVKPPGAVWVRLELRGGDGAADSTSATATPPCHPGRYTHALMRADQLPDEVEITVGRAGRSGRSGRDDRASGHGWARVTTYFEDPPTSDRAGRAS